MPVRVTEEAWEVLRNSLELTNNDPSKVGLRIRRARALGGGFQVQVDFAQTPEADDTLIEEEGVRLFLAREVLDAIPDAVVTVEPMHDIITVQPA